MPFVDIRHLLCGGHFYVGITGDLDRRLVAHTTGRVRHTAKHRPWRVRTYMAFTDRSRTVYFEKYLKSGSGRAFAGRHI